VPGQVLYFLARQALFEQIGGDRRAEWMRAW
jgi:hypothetical protein